MAEPLLDTIGRYKVTGVLGKGAMGVVYKAVDPVIDREVAIKTIKLSLSEEELAFYEARFAQEIKTVGKLNHPNIVTIYDVGRTDEFAYMAMEFIAGPELKLLMAPGAPIDPATAVHLIAQTADGLAFAHARDIVHRDVKPSNIMVLMDDDGMVAKVTDFGIARGPTSSVKTMTGMILGSPRYMSPEQVIGKNLGPRSDVFSLGVVLYEMLAGAPPFDAESVSSIMYQTVHVHAEPLSRRAVVPESIEAVVAKALAKEPDARWASMKDFARALRDVARELPAPKPSLPRAPSPLDTGPHVRVVGGDAAEPAHMVSLSFDSLAGTERLMAMVSPSAPPAPAAPAAPEPSRVAVEAPVPAPRPAPAPAPVATATATEHFPAGAALLLGSLALVAFGLALAILLR